ncbi:MAG: hypothetical protein KF723_23055 [Rhizobiaceae bacterium]|nr:hypothetical protein [Rhizobiaceae bacterium]
MSPGTLDVLAERERQLEVEGWSSDHDDKHDSGEIASAAAAYALPDPSFRLKRNGEGQVVAVPRVWPWSAEWWKPKSRRQNLVRAGALILAELDRLDRAAERERAGK